MAIDLEKLRALHEELNKEKKPLQDYTETYVQTPVGDTMVRILPGKDGKEFYASTKLHRVKTGQKNDSGEDQFKNIHCRRYLGELCPLCDVYYALYKTGIKSDEKRAKDVKPRLRYYLNAVERARKDDKGNIVGEDKLKILSIGEMLFKKIVNTMMDPDYGDITDFKTGRDFKITKVIDAGYPKYDQSAARPVQTPLGTDLEIAKYLESMHDIYALVKLEDYEEVKRIAMEVMPEFKGFKERTLLQESTPNTSGESLTSEEYLEKLKSIKS